MYAHPGKKLMFMGCEFGQHSEWNHDHSLDWHLLDAPLHRQLRLFVQDLNRVYAAEPALHQVDFDPAGFQWIDCNDSDNSVVSFIRRASAPDDFVVAVVNFTPVPRDGYRIGVPAAGAYQEVLNSDSDVYGGSNLGNAGAVFTEPVASHGHADSLRLSLPPLGFLHAEAGTLNSKSLAVAEKLQSSPRTNRRKGEKEKGRELSDRFCTLSDRKARDAERAALMPLVTIEDRAADAGFIGIGNAWTHSGIRD